MNNTDGGLVDERGAAVEPGLDADLAELVRMSETLCKWETLPWAEVQRLTKAIGPRVLAQLVGRGLWDRMTAAEQASTHWAMAGGHSVSCLTETYARPDFVGPRVTSLREAADYTAAKCGAYGGRRMAAEPSIDVAAEYVARFDALPEGWRVEAMRRAAASGDIVAAIAGASMAMNVLHSVYGIAARTP